MIEPNSATWREVVARLRVRIKEINREVLKTATPLERIPALRAARKELIDLLKLDPQYKDEWSEE